MTSAGVEPIDAVILILLGMITGSSLNFAGADRAGANALGARSRTGCSFRRGAGYPAGSKITTA